MYIDILPNDNLSEPVMATFKETGARRAILAVRLELPDGWSWCAITGWSENGAVPALFTPIEESGDGPGRLISGGEHGLRLAHMRGPGAGAAWDLHDTTQWAEPFLLCLPETQVVYAENEGEIPERA
jgi:hypothetical protein